MKERRKHAVSLFSTAKKHEVCPYNAKQPTVTNRRSPP